MRFVLKYHIFRIFINSKYMVAKFPFEIIDNGVIYAFRIAFRGREKLNTLSTLQNNIRQPGVIIDLLNILKYRTSMNV